MKTKLPELKPGINQKIDKKKLLEAAEAVHKSMPKERGLTYYEWQEMSIEDKLDWLFENKANK